MNSGEAWVKGKREDKKRPALTPARAEEQKERQQRLAAALRENLGKRKSQKRKRIEADGAGAKD